MKIRKIVSLSLLAIVGALALYLLWIYAVPRLATLGKKTDRKVYVAFGFHGNLYHSYRIDTNDEAGFGKDIRVIRKIIRVLDEKNRAGVKVKGVWDIENLFSLQETLPRYAPDIIRDIRRRVKENGDEVILMSYNNGLASALDEREFRDSVKRAITNKEKSGVKDLFGKWSPYVRPQEVMATPGNYRLYKELGLKGIVLYYSAITFDAFRAFERELTMEEAHNPLTYRNRDTGEEFLVIPAYNQGDLPENVSLRRWVRELHREQVKGNIKRDVLLFINADADDDYWYGYKLPPHLAWLPNTGGLNQLIDGVTDLDYVRFTTLAEYLKDHGPAGDIHFGQDTADGSFNGYVSWSEKAYSHDYWTEVTRDRRTHAYVKNIYGLAGLPVPGDVREQLERSYEKRLRLESTTNFGMATPFLARTRERVVESIIRDLRKSSLAARERADAKARDYIRSRRPEVRTAPGLKPVDIFLFTREDGKAAPGYGDFIRLLVRGDISPAGEFYVSGRSGGLIHARTVSIAPTGVKGLFALRLFIPARHNIADGVYHLYTGPAGLAKDKEAFLTSASKEMLTNGPVKVKFSGKGIVKEVTLNGEEMLRKGSILPKIRYGECFYAPEKLRVTVERDGSRGVASVRLRGGITLPAEGAVPGMVDYRLVLLDGVPALFVDADVTYPDTPRGDVFKPGRPALARMYDKKWQEVAPMELSFAPAADRKNPFLVLKRNFLEVESSYPIDYFRHSRKNLDLANVNNHITAEYAALAGRESGIAVAMDNPVLSNFAFCPIRVEHNLWSGFRADLNPFGTYFGEQYYQPTWGSGLGYRIALLEGDQYNTAACTYSGHSYAFSVMISFFKGRRLPGETRDGLVAFAHPPFAVTLEETAPPAERIPVKAPAGFMAAYGDGGLYFHWEKPRGEAAKYIISCGTESGKYSARYEQSGRESTLFVKEFMKKTPFEKGKTYFASIAVIGKDGRETARAKEIAFIPRDAPKGGMDLPIGLQLRVLWATVLSYID